MSTILVVDDDAHVRDSLKDNLELAKYSVDEAATGAQAIEKMVTGLYDVVIMDFNLGDKTGIQVIQEIRKSNQDTEIIMLTGQTDQETAVKALREQVFDYLGKPVEFPKLAAAIEKALDRFHLRQDNKRLMAQLKESNTQLLSLNNMKSKFLSMASHDLSNALMTLQVSFELMAPQLDQGDADQKKRMRYIADSLSQISRLVEDLVDWASIEKGKFRLEKEPFQLAETVENLLTGLKQRAAAKQIAIQSEQEPGLPPLTADRRRLMQVLNNLIENAIRHTPKGGSIKVRVARKSPDVEVSVQDTGAGIEPADLERIFQSFYQGEGGTGGRLGLGLSISREIVASHGGKIWVESPGKGKGSTFRFTLPLSGPPQEKA